MASPKAVLPATTSAPTDDALLSQLRGVFTRSVHPDERAPTIDPEHLRRPVIVLYTGSREISYTRENQQRHSTLYQFASKAGKGAHFSVFGNANLATRLKKLTGRGPIVLAYAGKTDAEGRAVHEWQVVAPGANDAATLERVRHIRDSAVWVEREAELDAVIMRALEEENERLRARRTSSGGSRNIDDIARDDDIPF